MPLRSKVHEDPGSVQRPSVPIGFEPGSPRSRPGDEAWLFLAASCLRVAVQALGRTLQLLERSGVRRNPLRHADSRAADAFRPACRSAEAATAASASATPTTVPTETASPGAGATRSSRSAPADWPATAASVRRSTPITGTTKAETMTNA